jgi:hypothetical protein
MKKFNITEKEKIDAYFYFGLIYGMLGGIMGNILVNSAFNLINEECKNNTCYVVSWVLAIFSLFSFGFLVFLILKEFHKIIK